MLIGFLPADRPNIGTQFSISQRASHISECLAGRDVDSLCPGLPFQVFVYSEQPGDSVFPCKAEGGCAYCPVK